jgi:hypothetical protein
MITIEHLEVQFDVDGDSDEQVFARYFTRCIARWQQNSTHERELRERLERDRQLGNDGSLR